MISFGRRIKMSILISPFSIDACKSCAARYECPIHKFTSDKLKIPWRLKIRYRIGYWRESVLKECGELMGLAMSRNWNFRMANDLDLKKIKMNCVVDSSGLEVGFITPLFDSEFLTKHALEGTLWP